MILVRRAQEQEEDEEDADAEVPRPPAEVPWGVAFGGGCVAGLLTWASLVSHVRFRRA